jgi:hypothetical protein
MNSKPEILLSCSYQDIDAASKASKALNENGIISNVTTCAINLGKVIGVVMTASTEKDRLLKENPWLQKELFRSGEARLKVLPFIIYDSKKEKLDDVWDKSVSKIYEGLFSDEFKPLAFDLSDAEQGSGELLRILQLYYTK